MTPQDELAAARRTRLVGGALLGVSLAVLAYALLRGPGPQQQAAVAQVPTAVCEAKLERCAELLDAQTRRCSELSMRAAAQPSATPLQGWLATGSGTPAASAAPGAQPAPEALRPVDDLDVVLGEWVDRERGDYIAWQSSPYGEAGKLVAGGVRVALARAGKKARAPYKLTFWAPRPGHEGSGTVSGACSVYRDVHPGRAPDGAADPARGWRAAYCTGYGRGASVATHLVLDAGGGQLRLDLENYVAATLVARRR